MKKLFFVFIHTCVRLEKLCCLKRAHEREWVRGRASEWVNKCERLNTCTSILTCDYNTTSTSTSSLITNEIICRFSKRYVRKNIYMYMLERKTHWIFKHGRFLKNRRIFAGVCCCLFILLKRIKYIMEIIENFMPDKQFNLF